MQCRLLIRPPPGYGSHKVVKGHFSILLTSKHVFLDLYLSLRSKKVLDC